MRLSFISKSENTVEQDCLTPCRNQQRKSMAQRDFLERKID